MSREVVSTDETSCTVLGAMYALRLLLIGHLRIFRLRKPCVLFAFLVIVEMCECHYKSLDTVMPR